MCKIRLILLCTTNPFISITDESLTEQCTNAYELLTKSLRNIQSSLPLAITNIQHTSVVLRGTQVLF
jgi:hypothetical protein